ncbi:MAG: hypothetical protein P1U57_13625, partial [Oleibacter sp.]|nr:hypothetical protein [Thalassolituus sp.]
MHDNHVQMEWEGKTYDMPHFFFPFTDPQETGDQIRGFGYTKDGSVGEVGTFLQNGAFIDYGPVTLNLVNPGGFQPYVEPGTWPADLAAYNQAGFLRYAYLAVTNDEYFSERNPETGEPVGREELRSVEDFVMVFPNNMAPIMGQQITLTANSPNSERKRLSTMEERAGVLEPRKECDLVARANALGLLFDPTSSEYIASDLNRFSRSALLALAPQVTFTCVPPGDGLRVALDRDLDGYFDAAEIAANTDPANADSYPQPKSWWIRLWQRFGA